MDGNEAGRLLASRHREQSDGVEPDRDRSLLNYAETPHAGDWTLRSALVRLAQVNPAQVGSLLESMRRLDAPLHHVARDLERRTVLCDRALTVDRLAGSPVEPYPDGRVCDLARLAAAGLDEVDLVGGYEELSPLDHEERVALPLLVLALGFQELAMALAGWAQHGPADPPLEAVERVRAATVATLDELGVPVETGPPPGSRRSTGV